MKKFILITVGFKQPTPEIMEKWMQWFKSIADKIESQVGLMNGKEISKDGNVKELEMDLEALTGYLIIKAENMHKAQEIARKCPMITSTLVYEIKEG